MDGDPEMHSGQIGDQFLTQKESRKKWKFIFCLDVYFCALNDWDYYRDFLLFMVKNISS